ncbi:MAG: oxidoreductase [Actinobacteria bacterium]|uniref:NAD(P)H-dependent oxidoreductase n=1 Tax=Propionicimonas sp. T2.31MG-18 TaxID=3157620 RepID=UPI0035EDAEF5|nr:oxidoreductase [Actinomycetota bacterium]
MSYTQRLLERQEKVGHPVRVGVVGAGQMGSGLIAQIERARGMQVAAVADIAVERGVEALTKAGRTDVVVETDLARAAELVAAGTPVVINDGLLMPKLPVDIVLEVSGVPEIAAQIAYASLLGKKDVALMTVEADVTVGLLLSSVANAGNQVYTICRGDEPVECLKLVEYAEDLGLTVVAAGKGKNNPNRPTDVPEDVMEEAKAKNMNPRMLCEFTDGTKTQLEMCALSNATGIPVDVASMHGPSCTIDELATKLIPVADGGILNRTPAVEYTVEGDVAPGIFVVVRSEDPVVTHELDYLKFGTGPYYAVYRPHHLASIEAHLSISEAVLDRRADFQTKTWRSEVTAKTKFPLKAGITLEGMGGHHVRGWTVDAEEARSLNAIPIGLVAGCRLTRDLPADAILTYDDVEIDETRPLVAMRRLQDALIASHVI